MIGQTIAHYQVTAKVGAGGMGEVYRATDTKLGREAAIKVLPGAFAQDAQRMARFQREAQVLASLNHPHIAAIYGLEESGATRALAMELVEGPTLGERIAGRALPLDEALPIAQQIAEALEYAHERGIIHRDLKPANIKLTRDGQVKILDFGLAKALADESSVTDISNSPTLSMAATKAGMILGTAAYMSPEQAKGKTVDRRADVWSFGCVLFEMLAGQQVFGGGETVTDTLAAVVRAEPEWNLLPASVPATIRRLLRRCLEKDPRQRLQAIGEARIAIAEAIASPGGDAEISAAGAAAAMAPAWKRMLPWAVAGVAALIAVGAAWKATSRPQTEAPVVRRFVVEMPRGQVVYGPQPGLAISPNGTHVAYLASRTNGLGWQLYLRAMDRVEAAPLGSDDDGGLPSFSPDGQWVAYFAGGKLKKVNIQEGTPMPLADVTTALGASWGPDGTIYYCPSPDLGLWRIPGGRGQPEKVPRQGKSEGLRDLWPDVLPDGQGVLVTAPARGGFDQATISLFSLRTGEVKKLFEGGSNPKYVPSGHIVYGRAGTLFAVPFDLKRQEITGLAVPVVQNVRMDGSTGAVYYSVARDGTLVYISSASMSEKNQLVEVDRHGNERTLGAPERGYSNPRISPDGKQVTTRVADSSNIDAWVYTMGRGLSRLTFQEEEDESPVWTPDGRQIVYSSSHSTTPRTIAWKNADGSGSEEVVLEAAGHFHVGAISPDGQWMIYTDYENTSGSRGDLWVLPLKGDKKPQVFLKTQFNEYDARLSPDGKWVAYTSDESGRNEVYVQPFPGPGGKWQISTDGGDSPVWARSGKEIFYRNGSKFYAASVVTAPSFSSSPGRLMFDHPYAENPRREAQYDVFPDGQRFLMLKGDAAAASAQYYVVTNWAEELKRLAPPKN